jgi:hypothetical protein
VTFGLHLHAAAADLVRAPMDTHSHRRLRRHHEHGTERL